MCLGSPGSRPIGQESIKSCSIKMLLLDLYRVQRTSLSYLLYSSFHLMASSHIVQTKITAPKHYGGNILGNVFRKGIFGEGRCGKTSGAGRTLRVLQ